LGINEVCLHACIPKKRTSNTPVSYKWHEKRFSIAKRWDGFYEKQMQMYSDLFNMILTGVQFQLTEICFVISLTLLSSLRLYL